MDLLGGIRWRYRTWIEPRLFLHRSPARMLRRWRNNRLARAADEPLAMIYADPTNSGDYAAYLGVRLLAGRPGAELFSAPIEFDKTIRAVRDGPGSGRRWSAVFVCGGSHLQGCFDPLWEGLLAAGAPLVLFGVGAAEALPRRRLTEPPLLARIATQARALHVRDHYTRKILEGAGATNVTVAPCPSVCWLHETAKPLPRASTHLLHAIHPVDLGFAGVSIDALRERVRALAGDLGLVYDETIHMESISTRLLARYARAAVIVSSRLHGCIFSYALEKPFVAVVCDQKLNAFLESRAATMPSLPATEALEGLGVSQLQRAIQAGPCPDLRAGMKANGDAMLEVLERTAQ